MELEQLKMFICAAESGSFTRAGQQMFVSHSTVSRAVSSLETELGARLIERGNKVIGLTEAGERVLEQARQLIAFAESISAEPEPESIGDAEDAEAADTTETAEDTEAAESAEDAQSCEPDTEFCICDKNNSENL